MAPNGGSDELAPLDLALVSAAILLSERYKIDTALARPIEPLGIVETCAVIAKLGSPPLRVSVARDLASAGFGVDVLEPLLRAAMPDGVDAGDDELVKRRDELVRLGPTVSWPGFPPGRTPDVFEPEPPDESTRGPASWC